MKTEKLEILYKIKKWTTTHKLASLFLREKAKVYTLNYTLHFSEKQRYNLLDIAIESPANCEQKIMSVLRHMMTIKNIK